MCTFLLAYFSFVIFMDVINTDNFKTIPILSGWLKKFGLPH